MTALFPFKAVPSRDRKHAAVLIQSCSHAVCTVTKFFQFKVCLACLRGTVTTLFPLKAVPSQCRNIAVYCTLKAVPIVLWQHCSHSIEWQHCSHSKHSHSCCSYWEFWQRCSHPMRYHGNAVYTKNIHHPTLYGDNIVYTQAKLFLCGVGWHCLSHSVHWQSCYHSVPWRSCSHSVPWHRCSHFGTVTTLIPRITVSPRYPDNAIPTRQCYFDAVPRQLCSPGRGQPGRSCQSPVAAGTCRGWWGTHSTRKYLAQDQTIEAVS